MNKMQNFILVALLSLAAIARAADSSIPNLQSLIDEENGKCESGDDSMACIKVRAMRFLDTVLNKDNFKLSDIEVRSNGYTVPVAVEQGRSAKSNNEDDGVIDQIENYIKGHDVTMDLPVADAKVTVSSRQLANDELNLSLKFADDSEDVVEGKGKKGSIFKKGRKHRLRKMLMPIMVLILLKALTVIPMAIGIIKIKALNALALGFFSFIVSVGLAIFQLCKKIAAEHHHAHHHITAHGHWDRRSFSGAANSPVLEQPEPIEAAHNLAYRAYI